MNFTKLFSTPSAESVRQQQLREAQRLELEHQAAAEHHAALAAMYRARVERLSDAGTAE